MSAAIAKALVADGLGSIDEVDLLNDKTASIGLCYFGFAW